MTYNPNIPEDLPSPDIATTLIRTNFSQYANVFDNNHAAINDSNQGKHTNVILQQISDPDVTDNLDSLYGKTAVAASGTTQEIFAKVPQFLPVDKPNLPMQLTFNVVNTAGPQYQSFMAGGYIIYWGTIPSATPTINTQVTLVPAPSKIVCVIPNPTKFAAVGGNPTRPVLVSATVNNSSQFTINATFPTGTGNVNWVAIAQQ